jgi:trimeric autotransporter adhesin
VAEDIQNVSPALVVRDKEGKPYSVRYDQVNAMLLNEFLKEHKAFVKEQRKVQRLEAALDAVNQRLKEQEVKTEKISAQVEMNKSAPQVARVP